MSVKCVTQKRGSTEGNGYQRLNMMTKFSDVLRQGLSAKEDRDPLTP